MDSTIHTSTSYQNISVYSFEDDSVREVPHTALSRRFGHSMCMSGSHLFIAGGHLPVQRSVRFGAGKKEASGARMYPLSRTYQVLKNGSVSSQLAWLDVTTTNLFLLGQLDSALAQLHAATHLDEVAVTLVVNNNGKGDAETTPSNQLRFSQHDINDLLSLTSSFGENAVHVSIFHGQ